MATWWPARAALEPFVSLLRPLPSITWIPLTILWLGIGESQKIAIVFVGSWIYILIYTYESTRRVDPLLIRAAQNLGDGVVTPVLEALSARGIPTVVYSGGAIPEDVRQRHPDLVTLSKPVLLTIAMFYAIGHWNEFIQPLLYLTDGRWTPLPVLLRDILTGNQVSEYASSGTLSNSSQESIQMAAVVLITLPMLLVYPWIQRHFTKGALMGGVKE